MAKRKYDRGGVVPYYIGADGSISMLFMKPSNPDRGGDCFQIAKGKINSGLETIEEGAFREAREELGLFMPNVARHSKVGIFMERTTIYIAEIIDPDCSKFGLPVDETGETLWMTESEFLEVGRPLHKPTVRSVIRAIKNETDIDS